MIKKFVYHSRKGVVKIVKTVFAVLVVVVIVQSHTHNLLIRLEVYTICGYIDFHRKMNMGILNIF